MAVEDSIALSDSRYLVAYSLEVIGLRGLLDGGSALFGSDDL